MHWLVVSRTLDITNSCDQPLGHFSCFKSLFFQHIKINASPVEEKAKGQHPPGPHRWWCCFLQLLNRQISIPHLRDPWFSMCLLPILTLRPDWPCGSWGRRRSCETRELKKMMLYQGYRTPAHCQELIWKPGFVLGGVLRQKSLA